MQEPTTKKRLAHGPIPESTSFYFANAIADYIALTFGFTIQSRECVTRLVCVLCRRDPLILHETRRVAERE
jgi:hypothetical protein